MCMDWSQIADSSTVLTTSSVMDSYSEDTNQVPPCTNTTRVHPHERNSPEAISEAVTLIIIMIASFFTNILAMTQILSSSKLRKNHHNLLIANLNVIDLGITLFSMTFSVAAIFDDGDLLRTNSIVCTINGFCAITCSVGNFTNVMCIAVDRYISIVWSARFPSTRRRAYIMIAFVWVVSITITLPPTFEFFSSFEYTESTHHCSPRWDVCGYYIIWFTVIFGVTVPVMIMCYACIIYHIRKSDRQLRFYNGFKTSSKRSKELSVSKNSGSVKDSPNLTTNAVHNSHPSFLQQATANAQHAELGTQNSYSVSEAHLNSCFQDDELDLQEIVIEEHAVNRTASRPFAISGQVEQSSSQSLHVIGQSTRESNVGNQNSSQEHGQKSSTANCSAESVRGQRLRGNTNSDDGTNLDNALNKSRKRKLSTDKRVLFTGAMLILTTILCWAPYCIIHFCTFPSVRHSVAAATMWMAYANSLLDPLVYVFMNRKESTVQHLSSILRTFCSLPRKACGRICGNGNDA